MYFWPFVIAATHHANVNICSHDHCIYFYFLCSLHFSHIHTSCTMSLRFIVEHRWKCCFNLNECRQTQLVLFVEALTQAQSSAHGRAPCLRTDLAQAVLAPISKIKFCTTLLRLQLAGRASFCCLFSQCVNEAAEPLVSGSHWRAQACSVGLSSELSLQALGNRVLSCWTETGTGEGHRCLPKEAGRDRTLEAVPDHCKLCFHTAEGKGRS